MNDTNPRIQDPLLPISHNAPGLAGQQRQTTTTTQVYAQGARYNPVPVAYVSSTSTSHDDSWSKAKRYCWWIAVVLTVVLVFLIVGLKLFLFKPISHHPPSLDNSTATEPNTKTKFNLLLQGPRNRVQSLLGAAVWTYTIPIPTHPKLSLAATGLYLERAEGKRRMMRFKGEDIDDERFEDVKRVLLTPGMTETLRVVLATTPPSGRLLQLWEDDTKPIMQESCPNFVDQEWKAFSDFFPDPFNKGDDFTFEWREGGDLYAYWAGTDRAKAKRIGGPCMAEALFEVHLTQQKQGLINLLDGFFER